MVDPQAGVVKAVCPLDCPDTCSMRVTVRDGVAVDLRGDPDHPFTRGFLCQKMARYLDRVYSPDRLAAPAPAGRARRARAGSSGSAGTRPSATIAERFAAIAGSPDGPQAILPYSYYGTMGKLQASSLDRRFFHRLGRLDARPDHLRLGRVRRLRVHRWAGAGWGPTRWRVPGCKLIINWGSNTAHTNSHLWSLMIRARKRGRDPGGDRPVPEPDRRPVRLAHPAPARDRRRARPGADARPLARRPDRRRLPRPGPPSAPTGSGPGPWRNTRSTGSPRSPGSTPSTIEELARRYAAERPSLIRLNYGLQRHHGGGMAVRTIACLPALVGAWRRPRRRGAALDQRRPTSSRWTA